jgi:hypothetical protein
MSVQVGVVVAGEVAKILLQMYFQQIQMAGLSAEESEKLYLTTRLSFLSNDPAKIPTV